MAMAVAPLPVPAAPMAAPAPASAAPAADGAITADLFSALVARIAGQADLSALPVESAGLPVSMPAEPDAAEEPELDPETAEAAALIDPSLLALIQQLALPKAQEAALIQHLAGQPADGEALAGALEAVRGKMSGGALMPAEMKELKDALAEAEATAVQPRTEAKLPEAADKPAEKKIAEAKTDLPQPEAAAVAAEAAQPRPAAPKAEAKPAETLLAAIQQGEGGKGGEAATGDKGQDKKGDAATILALVPGQAQAKPEGGQAVQNFTAALNAARSQPSHPAVESVAVRLAKAAGNAPDRLTLNLRPAELGAVEIRLDLGKDGLVNAVILADRPDTLNMLQKDRAFLERALTSAGYSGEGATLNFGLRQEQQQQQQSQQSNRRNSGTGFALNSVTEETSALMAIDPSRLTDPGRVNIRV